MIYQDDVYLILVSCVGHVVCGNEFKREADYFLLAKTTRKKK